MKQILNFDKERFDLIAQSYQNNTNTVNRVLEHYRQIKGAPIQDKEEGEKIRLEPLKSILEVIATKSGFPNNPLEFQLSASGLGMDYQTFINYLEGKDQILKLDIYEFKQGHFEVSQKALDQLEKDLTTYATDDQLPKLQYFQKLAESLNNGIEIGYISENQRANICRAIQGLELQVKNGKYVIGLNTRSLFNS